MSREIIGKGAFYLVLDGGDHIIMEDMTKRGLEVRTRSPDARLGVDAEKGIIHDMDGIGHEVPIRWFFPRDNYDAQKVMVHAEEMEQKYTKMRELTCPD